jgi:hypothetical protein
MKTFNVKTDAIIATLQPLEFSYKMETGHMSRTSQKIDF